MSYHGNLNSRQIALIEDLKKSELNAVSDAIRKHLILRDKTRAGGGVYAENDERGNLHTYRFNEELKLLKKLHSEYDSLYRMSLPTFLEKFPHHRAHLLKNYPGDFAQVRSQTGKGLFFLVVIFAALLPRIFKNIFSDGAILAFILVVGAIVLFYAASLKQSSYLEAR
ncbi:MAG: hypothetical protein AABW88_02610 [Nanoarchaeota archaeon]